MNLDSIVFAQRPKIAPHAEAIRRRIAELFGTEEAIMAQCVVLLKTEH